MPAQIPDALLPLFEDGLIDEVLRPLMSGKEASVYLVRSRGMECVAKVYKDAQHRTFRQRAAYSEGRKVRSTREQRAMKKGSAYGKSLLEANWQNAEVDSLFRLHEAGVRVPVPYHHAKDVLLMELVQDADGDPAPRLGDVDLDPETARLFHEILIREIVWMLCAGLVHGDLSPYNILVAPDGPVIIDLPQATDAAANSNSEAIFLRDVKTITNFLGRTAPELLKTRYGPEIWDLYTRAELTPESTLTGRFTPKASKVDTERAVAEIRAAVEDAAPRPLSAYQLKKQRRAEEAKAAAEAEAKAPAQDRRPADGRNADRGRSAKGGRDAKDGRSANRGRSAKDGRKANPGRTANDGRAAAPAAAGEPAAKRRRRRTKRKSSPNAGPGPSSQPQR